MRLSVGGGECAAVSDVTLGRRRIAESEMPIFSQCSLADITLVDGPEKSRIGACRAVAAAVIGFDTESKPTFHWRRGIDRTASGAIGH